MIANYRAVQELEDGLVRDAPVDVAKNLKIADAMYEEARRLGVFEKLDPLDGIEVVIRIARVVNSVRRAS